ncbi:MAG: HEAT repeat domain-containing protein [Planctomycetota bacterium]
MFQLADNELVERIAESLSIGLRDDTATLINSLERLMPVWQSEQRRLQERPLEAVLTIKVVLHFDQLLEAFGSGPREWRLVAAWALGFSRVPANQAGLLSPHSQAVLALSSALGDPDDEVLRNVLLALWRLADEHTSLPPILELLGSHHDPEVRANAALTLGHCLNQGDEALARDAVVTAMKDTEPKVRLHGSSIARRFPSSATSTALRTQLAAETVPLVRAGIAIALGAAKDRTAAGMLVEMLNSPREIEATAARQALHQTFGVDKGGSIGEWKQFLSEMNIQT